MNGRRILVADDNQDSAESFALLLSMQGHQVRCAHNGEDALQVFDEFQPDTVLLDITMPRIDGYEVARRIRAADPDRRVLLIAVTGWARMSDIEDSLACGFDHHFSKPVEPGVVTRLIAG